MTNLTIKIEKEDIKTSEIGNNIMVNCENNISLIFTREALEELINDYNDIKKDEAIIKVIDNIILETSPKEEVIEKDFATKEQRDTFNDIMSKITGTKKSDEYPDSTFYMVGDDVYMEYVLNSGTFYIKHNNFWQVFESKFNLNYQEISELLSVLLEYELRYKTNITHYVTYLRSFCWNRISNVK